MMERRHPSLLDSASNNPALHHQRELGKGPMRFHLPEWWQDHFSAAPLTWPLQFQSLYAFTPTPVKLYMSSQYAQLDTGQMLHFRGALGYLSVPYFLLFFLLFKNFLLFNPFYKRFSHLESWKNKLCFWTHKVGAKTYGADITRLGAISHGTELCDSI